MQRYIMPVLVVATLAALLAWLYGARAWQGYMFSRKIGTMLTAARNGDLQQVESSIILSQRQSAADQFFSMLPADYTDGIQSLKTTHWEWLDDNSIVAVVTCRYREADYQGIYQGRLLWRYQSSEWRWDFNRSSVAVFNPAGEQDWVKLSDMWYLAEQPD